MFTRHFRGVLIGCVLTAIPGMVAAGGDSVAIYLFNETSGTSAFDSSGSGQIATINGNATRVVGFSGNAVNLDGTSGYIQLPDDIATSLTDFTISLWVNIASISNWQRLFDFGTDTTGNMFLTPQSGEGTFRFAITMGGNAGEERINAPFALATGVWKQVAVTLSGSTGTLYVDGKVAGTNNAMTLTPSSLGPMNQNFIGKSQYNDPYLNGKIDNFRIYNRALSAGEMDSLYQNETGSSYTLSAGGLGGRISLDPSGGRYASGTVVTITVTPNPGYTFLNWSGDLSDSTNPTAVTMNGNKSIKANFASNGKLLAQYLFNDSSETSAFDSSGNGYTATLAGNATWATGFSGNVVNLDGSSGFVQLPDGIVSPLTDFTISLWVNIASISNWQRLFDFGIGTTVYMFLSPQSGGGTLRFAITTAGGANEQQINASSALETGVWKQVAITLSGTTGTLYVDGKEVGTNSSMTLTPSDLGLTNRNYIGKSQYNDPYLNGRIDNFKIYNSALSAFEIDSLFKNEIGSSVTLAASGAGGSFSFDPSGARYAVGTVVTVTATPDFGYTFSGWSGDLTGSANPAAITLNSDTSISALFTVIPYCTLTINSAHGSVSVSPAGGVYDKGTLVIITATPDSGYAFIRWSGDLSGIKNPDTVIMDTNKSVTAEFDMTGTAKSDAGRRLFSYAVYFTARGLKIDAEAGAHFSVADLSGRTIVTAKTTAASQMFTIPHMRRGVYLVKIVGADRVAVRKIICR